MFSFRVQIFDDKEYMRKVKVKNKIGQIMFNENFFSACMAVEEERRDEGTSQEVEMIDQALFRLEFSQDMYSGQG